MAARDAPDGKYTFDLLTADVVALMDALSIKRAHFAGLSMGGMTALFLAQRHPDRFDRVIACDCGPASTPASAQQWKERIELARREGHGGAGRRHRQPLVSARLRRYQGAVLDKVRGMIRTTPYKGFAGCAAGALRLRPAARARRHQEPDPAASAAPRTPPSPAMEQITRRDAGLEAGELEGAGHISNVEQPQAFTRAVADFLKG